MQGTGATQVAKPGAAVPPLDQGNPSVPNPSAKQPVAPGGAPSATPQSPPGTLNLNRLPGETNAQYRARINAESQRLGRSNGNPQINIPDNINLRNAVPQGAVDIMTGFFVMVVFCVVGLPIAKAIARRMNAKSTAIENGAAHMSPQMEQLQQSIDAMAVELERISEAQRFQAKLMAGKEPAQAPR